MAVATLSYYVSSFLDMENVIASYGSEAPPISSTIAESAPWNHNLLHSNSEVLSNPFSRLTSGFTKAEVMACPVFVQVAPFWPALARDFLPFKPDPAPLLHICEAWAVQPSEVMIVGDSATDDVRLRATSEAKFRPFMSSDRT